MFGLFLTGACLTFLLIFIVPFSVKSRLVTLPIMVFTFLNALFIAVAAVIATVMFVRTPSEETNSKIIPPIQAIGSLTEASRS